MFKQCARSAKKKNYLKFECPTPSGGGKSCGNAKYRVLQWLSVLRFNLGSDSGFFFKKNRLLVISL
jgi:hypothetical protein